MTDDPTTTTAASEPLRVIVPPGRSYGIIDTNREEPTMTTQATERRAAEFNYVERDIDAIERTLDHLRQLMADRSMRRDNATAAGATLAYEVERFLDDPDGVGTDALRKAWAVFMGRHSGDFTDSVMAPDGT